MYHWKTRREGKPFACASRNAFNFFTGNGPSTRPCTKLPGRERWVLQRSQPALRIREHCAPRPPLPQSRAIHLDGSIVVGVNCRHMLSGTVVPRRGRTFCRSCRSRGASSDEDEVSRPLTRARVVPVLFLTSLADMSDDSVEMSSPRGSARRVALTPRTEPGKLELRIFGEASDEPEDASNPTTCEGTTVTCASGCL